MVEQLNRLLASFRIRLVSIASGSIHFEFLSGWGVFALFDNGGLMEHSDGRYFSSARSKWLEGISKGLVRDDAGNLSQAGEAKLGVN